MKKFLIFFALVSFSLPVFAATINFIPAEVSVTAGQQISVVVQVHASEERVVTVKAALSYPQDLLEPVSFSFAPHVIQLAQPGYDQMNNGVIVKTAGFPGGFTGTREFGTLVLRAKQTGAAIVSVSNESLLLNAQSANRLSGSSSVLITIAVPVSTASGGTSTLLKTSEANEATSSTATTSAQSAAIAGLNGQPLRPVLILTLLIIATLAGIVWRMYRRSSDVV